MVPSKAFVSSIRLVMSAFTCWPKAAGWSDLGKRLMNSCSRTMYPEKQKRVVTVCRVTEGGPSRKKVLRSRQLPKEPQELLHRKHGIGIYFTSTVVTDSNYTFFCIHELDVSKPIDDGIQEVTNRINLQS